jgi:hypothetical protein
MSEPHESDALQQAEQNLRQSIELFLNQNDSGIQEAIRFYAEALVEHNPEMGLNDTELVLRGRFEDSVTVFTQELKELLTESIDTTPPA